MNQQEQDELEELREEVKELRERLSAAGLEARLADRDREYQHRIAVLEKSAVAIAASGGRVDAQFLQLLSLVKAVVSEIHVNGYVVVPKLLDRVQVERVRDNLAPLFTTIRRKFERLDPREPRQTSHVQNVLAKSRAADEVAVHPILRAIISGILGPDFLLHAGAVVMAPDPGCIPQQLHRDDGAYPLLSRPHLPLVVTAAIALDEFTNANGATRIVPGSCCWPASREPQPEEVIQIEMSAGSMLLWDGADFHGSGGNITKDQTRRTLTLNYTRGWLRTQYNQYLSIPRSVVLAMPPELQRDLGYHVSARGLGACDNENPLTYLRRMISRGGDGTQAMLGKELDEGSPETQT